MFERAQRVAVLGLGYVGLPMAMHAVEVGHDVIGFDIDKARVDALKRGLTFIDDITSDDVAAALATGRFRATTAPESLAGFDTAVVSVPTPLRDGVPDISAIEHAARLLAPYVRPGCCCVLESTTYPGTTEEVFVPLLEEGSGLTAGRDFRVVYSPERIDPGSVVWGFANTPKIVSGIDEASRDAVAAFYATVVQRVVPVDGTTDAELAKLLENTFRHVNIALVNELAVFCHELGVDVWSVIDAAASKPFGFMRFNPGPGVGGHCLPIDPSYLSWRVQRRLGRTFRFVEIANDVNDHMPDYVAQRVMAHLNGRRMAVNGSRILLVGLSYKRNSGDARHSPAIVVAERLRALGAEVSACDPLIDPQTAPDGIALVDCAAEALDAADLIVLLTDHDAYDYSLLEQRARRVLDTRNRVRHPDTDRL
jgi:UDP-N-acetyl-D-mannosaminuronic acid dehydrogenase/UDP-N-acetyl-D-glucosamine dehydrogenase